VSGLRNVYDVPDDSRGRSGWTRGSESVPVSPVRGQSLGSKPNGTPGRGIVWKDVHFGAEGGGPEGDWDSAPHCTRHTCIAHSGTRDLCRLHIRILTLSHSYTPYIFRSRTHSGGITKRT
jgi:hypothetical protein